MIRFIKLGDGGKWERYCIEDEQVIRLDYISPYHQNCLDGDWETVRQCWLKYRNGNKATATRDLNQIRDFYELSKDDIWITFYQRKMYWCHAEEDVVQLDDGSRIRKVFGSWSCDDINGNPLTVDNIDGRVTKVQGYRGTICGVEREEYLLRKIEGKALPEIESTKKALDALVNHVEELIKGLWWKDFELLIDLIFSHAGWQRMSVLGKTEKDIDLDVFLPVSNKRAFVQVKSRTTQKEFSDYVETFDNYKQYDEMFFVYHSRNDGNGALCIGNPKVTVWDLSRVAELTVNAGLINWLLEKRS